MAVFACAGCDAALTAPVSRVALPVHTHQTLGHELVPPLLEPGTYAVDPEPSGPPWRRWNEIEPAEAEARGVYAPVFALSFGSPGAIAVTPGDTRGTVLIPDRCDGGCLGLDGRYGPNLACARCGLAVATRIDDCGLWQAVWLAPDAVRHLPVDGPVRQVDDWETLAELQGTPPLEQSGVWDPRWEAAVGAALPHLLAASAGEPVAVDGLVADTFGHALDVLLPAGSPAKEVALAGPGLPATDADIALVPLHPRTGTAWESSGTAETVPLAAEVWLQLAFHHERLPVPATGGLPDGVLRDDPLPLHPGSFLRPDWRVFLHVLARLPAVREPWLRRIYDEVADHPYARPF